MCDCLLLDTCAAIWLSQDESVSQAALHAIGRSRRAGNGLRVSVMTAWEIGMLISKGRLPSTRHAERWFEEFVISSGVDVEGVNPAILIAASYLPEPIHNDPIDRILIATAREADLTIVTRDRAILAYGAAGHVRTLAC